MTQASSRRWITWDRLALSGNTNEVDRLAGLIPRIESRMRLTERLDECQSAATDYESSLPPSVKWDRDRKIFNIRETVWQQIISDTEEKAASARLDALMDPAGWQKDFPARLKQHIASLRAVRSGALENQVPAASKFAARVCRTACGRRNPCQ